MSASDTPAWFKQSLMSLSRLFECETSDRPIFAASSTSPRPRKTPPPKVAVSKLKINGRVIWSGYITFRLIIARWSKDKTNSNAQKISKLIREPRKVVDAGLEVKRRGDGVQPVFPNALQNFPAVA